MRCVNGSKVYTLASPIGIVASTLNKVDDRYWEPMPSARPVHHLPRRCKLVCDTMSEGLNVFAKVRRLEPCSHVLFAHLEL